MILSVHAFVGAAAGRIFPNPVVAFIIAFLSHFILDALPHWEYGLASFSENKENPLLNKIILSRKTINDLLHTSFDFLVGAIIAILIFKNGGIFTKDSIPLIAGIFGGIFPDILQLAYFKIRRQPFTTLQKFHLRIHTKRESPIFPYGLISQTLVIMIVIIILKFI